MWQNENISGGFEGLSAALFTRVLGWYVRLTLLLEKTKTHTQREKEKQTILTSSRQIQVENGIRYPISQGEGRACGYTNPFVL